MGRKANEDVPDHPAILKELYSLTKYGRDYTAVKVRCPRCQTERVFPLSHVRERYLRGNFTGNCMACRKRRPRTSAMAGRVRLPDGFIRLQAGAVGPEDDALYQKLANSTVGSNGAVLSSMVLEHVFKMAKLLGRPLAAWEGVRHRNGKRADNRIKNLELFIRRGSTHAVLDELKHAHYVIDMYGRHEEALQAAAAAYEAEAAKGPSELSSNEP